MRTYSCLAAVALLAAGLATADYYQDNYANYDGLDLGKYYDDGQGYDDMYSYDEFGYGADKGDPEYGGYGEDNLHYYGDEYDEYYEQYGTYGDQYGDDYFFDYEERVTTDCTEDESGAANVTGAICDIKISGVDKIADKLPGGIDGTYKVKGCWNGRPKYKRQNSPKNQDRTLWFSKMFSDWDISSGSEVDEVAILMYGGDGMEEARPNFVDPSKWHLTSKYSSQNKSEEYGYLKLNITMKCVDGKQLKADDNSVYRPLITADEMESKYRAIYTRYGPKHDPDPTVNFTMVVFMVMIGISVVLGIPYMMFRKKGGKGSPAKSFAQVLEDSRKRRAGHTL